MSRQNVMPWKNVEAAEMWFIKKRIRIPWDREKQISEILRMASTHMSVNNRWIFFYFSAELCLMCDPMDYDY